MPVTPQRLRMQKGGNHPSLVKKSSTGQWLEVMSHHAPDRAHTSSKCREKSRVFAFALGQMTMPIGHQDGPEDDNIHQDKHMDNSIEQTKVESLSGMGGLGRRGHGRKNDRLPAVIIFVDIGVVEVGKAPSL